MDIRSKIVATLAVSTVIVSSTFRLHWPIIAAILYLLPLIWMLVIKRFRMAFIYILLMLASYLTTLPGADQIVRFLPFFLIFFLGIIQFVLPGLAMGALLLQTSTVSEYINAMYSMRAPAAFTIATSVIFRFVPTLREENQGIKEAIKMRKLGGLRAWRHPLQYLNYRLVPLLLSAARIGDELSMASLCRGLSTSRQRTVIDEQRLRARDYLVIILSLILVVIWAFTLIKAKIG